MTRSRFSVSSCSSLLMAFLFALSASFQFDDPGNYPFYFFHLAIFLLRTETVSSVDLISFCVWLSDWYFWFPLYALACLVNMVNRFTKIAKITLLMGTILFLKVVIEDVCFHQGISGIWSFDMRERVVREKIGSGLVILSMSLLLQKGNPNSTTPSNHVELGNFSTFLLLICFSYVC